MKETVQLHLSLYKGSNSCFQDPIIIIYRKPREITDSLTLKFSKMARNNGNTRTNQVHQQN